MPANRPQDRALQRASSINQHASIQRFGALKLPTAAAGTAHSCGCARAAATAFGLAPSRYGASGRESRNSQPWLKAGTRARNSSLPHLLSESRPVNQKCCRSSDAILHDVRLIGNLDSKNLRPSQLSPVAVLSSLHHRKVTRDQPECEAAAADLHDRVCRAPTARGQPGLSN